MDLLTNPMTKGTKVRQTVRIRIPVTGHGHTNGGDTLLGWLLVVFLAVTPSWLAGLAAGETTTGPQALSIVK
jgi:hypothetical protein